MKAEHTQAQVQWRLALPLLDRVRDWLPAALASGGLRVFDLIYSVTQRPDSARAVPTP